MTPTEKYKSAADFRKAVQNKLKEISDSDGIDIQRLYRQVAYSQLLKRLFNGNDTPWVLKGGHALELRLQKARATKDIDLALKEAAFFDKNANKRNESIKEALIEKSRIDLGDYFDFEISGPVTDLENAPYGGARYSIDAKIDGRTFSKFQIDIGIGDVWIEPHDEIPLKNHLESTAIDDATVRVINIEQHLAEKFHAYTLPRDGRINSRPKDLVDIYVILETEKIDSKTFLEHLKLTFERRKSHEIPTALPDPPTEWDSKFKPLILEVGYDTSMKTAFKEVSSHYSSLLKI